MNDFLLLNHCFLCKFYWFLVDITFKEMFSLDSWRLESFCLFNEVFLKKFAKKMKVLFEILILDF